ncbi:MAG: hypothetical protein U0X89_05360 [Bacteroidia bacterium]
MSYAESGELGAREMVLISPVRGAVGLTGAVNAVTTLLKNTN